LEITWPCQLLNTTFPRTSELSVEVFDALHAVNTRGLMLCVRAVSAAMKTQEPLAFTPPRSSTSRSLGRGAIVNLGSTASYLPAPGFLPYVATKHAILGITKNAGEKTQAITRAPTTYVPFPFSRRTNILLH
jgi:NAD(P)-dependent dehydrogenase (short-subunit alcohol dehydrogenase family)